MKRHAIFLSLILASACSAPPEKKQPEPAAPAQSAQTVAPAPVSTPAPEPAVQPEMRSADRKQPAKQPAKSAPVSKAPAKGTVAAVPVPPPPPEPRAPVSEPPPQQIVRNAPIEVPPPPPPDPPQPRHITLPSGTLIDVRMIDAIDSGTDHVGQSFKASMAKAVQLGNDTIIPKGSDVYVKLVDVTAAGNMKGTSQLRVQLDRLFVGNKAYTVESNAYTETGKSQTKQTAKTVGIGTAIGAAIGAIAGGKKGAVIGAGAGAGGGAAVEAATKGEQVRIESEAPLTFRLETPIELTLPPKPQ